MDDLNSDVLVNIISYLNVLDGSRLSQTSRRMFYFVHEYPKVLGPQVVGASSILDDQQRQQQRQRLQPPKSEYDPILEQAMKQLRTKPNIAFWFHCDYPFFPRIHKVQETHTRIPPSTVVVGTISADIQANIPHEQQPMSDGINSSLLLGSFSRENTRIVPFAFQQRTMSSMKEALHSWVSNELEEPAHNTHNDDDEDDDDDDNYWKVFVVYACDQMQTESFVQQLQSKYPHAAIVGGFCRQGYVSLLKDHNQETSSGGGEGGATRKSPRLSSSSRSSNSTTTTTTTTNSIYEICEIKSGIFGVAMGGDVPIQSIVSRGVQSILPRPPKISTTITPPPPPSSSSSSFQTPWTIHSSFLSKPSDRDTYPFRTGCSSGIQTPVHIIQKFQNTHTQEILSPVEMMQTTLGRTNEPPDFVGICRPGEDGYQLLQRFGLHGGEFLVLTDGSDFQVESLQEAAINFFALDGEASCVDMEVTLDKLQKASSLNDDVLLGAIMFSCNGRGPTAGHFIAEDMADANRFFNKFPHVPCCGFYAGGEIGPRALAGNENVFQRGHAAVQGFTAVFAVFVVPKNPIHYHLDDSPENIKQYVRTKLLAS